ncbi:DUF4270 family protein [Parapedobacter indicus]|uniref:DUF4270 domain-containing protein n=1 Tax=Parapedobacter indicus TaxID=1477437 RepID=A0A1I3F771_9SPHI|nr:DUF4270 family protein [Parapedobacter indicus]PPL03589.1 uncharacterized protein DUF4270 [Parapedobacter indicus]SFI07000.1 protein of unknown function [Parapedobacter indicus]
MRNHTKDLLTLLISLFVLGGCTNPSGIGLDVDPGDEISGNLTTLTLEGATILDDSTRSSSFNQTAFGWFNDPVIGKTAIDLALAIGKPSSVPRIRPDAEIDSVILVLPYGIDEYFGDTINPTFPLQVRQLKEAYTDGNYSTKQWAVEEEVIGAKTLSRFAYKKSDSVRVTKYIDDKDSVVRDVPQLRMSLSAGFFKELLSNTVDSATLSTEAGFNSHVKGLYLSVDESAMSGIGGIVTFQGLSGTTGIELTYRQPNGKEGDDAGMDTIRTFLPTAVSTQDAYGSGTTYRRLTSSIRRTYTADVQTQLENPEGSFDKLYIQAPAGLRTRLRIPAIDELKGRNIAVNKAELVVYVDEEAEGAEWDMQAPRLTLYREDIAGQRQPVPDGDSRTSGGNFIGDARSFWDRYTGDWGRFGGALDGTRRRYVFHLTSYIQDILLGKINSSDFYIAPATPSERSIPYYPVLNTGSRAILENGEMVDTKIKLNIYYTQVED